MGGQIGMASQNEGVARQRFKGSKVLLLAQRAYTQRKKILRIQDKII